MPRLVPDLRPPWRALIAIGVASFAVCALLDLTYFAARTQLISGDEQRLLASAQHLLETGEFRVGADKAWEMPGTAAFFAALLWLFPSHSLLAIRLVQGLFVALQSVCVGALAQLLFRNAPVTIVAALMAGFYPYFVFTQGAALSETLFTLLLVAGFLCLFGWRVTGARSNGRLLTTSLIFVLATMTKATLTVMGPLLIIVAAIGERSARSLLAVALVATLSYAVLMAPWWTRNYLALGAFVPFTTSASQALYVGNNRDNPTAYPDWAMIRSVPEFGIPDELARFRAFRDKALQYILEDPAAFLSRAWIKFRRFWSIAPNAKDFQGAIYLIVGAATFGFVLLFSLICAVSQYRRFLDFLPIYLTVGYFTALYTVTAASIRYRLPIEPLLIVLAARPATTLLAKIVKTSNARLSPAVQWHSGSVPELMQQPNST
jgi:hypothetical protein